MGEKHREQARNIANDDGLHQEFCTLGIASQRVHGQANCFRCNGRGYKSVDEGRREGGQMLGVYKL